jgi:hypothetical protein
MYALVGRLLRAAGVHPLTSTPEGDLLAAQGHGKYNAAVMTGNVYSATSQTGVVLTVGLATTYTGVCLSNPNGSGKALSILAAGFSEVVAPTGIQTAFLAAGYSTTDVTHSVAGVPVNMRLGRAIGCSGKFDTGATLPVAPKYVATLNSGHTSGALSTAACPALYELGGLCILDPGGFAIIAGFTVGVAVGCYGCIIWEEIDI